MFDKKISIFDKKNIRNKNFYFWQKNWISKNKFRFWTEKFGKLFATLTETSCILKSEQLRNILNFFDFVFVCSFTLFRDNEQVRYRSPGDRTPNDRLIDILLRPWWVRPFAGRMLFRLFSSASSLFAIFSVTIIV